jgi:hypothetical protein
MQNYHIANLELFSKMQKEIILTGCLSVLLILVNSCGSVNKPQADAYSGPTKVTSQIGNSLYHQTEIVKLTAGELNVAGEVVEPGKADFSKIYEREVFVKETLLNGNNEPAFTGAYRYSGYSLFDVLNEFKLSKKNAAIFRPEIDVFIRIENDKGESVVFSWSEIFHSLNPHRVIIATSVAPVKPHRKEVNYPVGKTWKIVASNDLYAFRNIENPVKITVISFDKKQYTINRNLETVYSPELKVIAPLTSAAGFHDQPDGTSAIRDFEFMIPQNSSPENRTRYNSTFYGMGMGYHPVPSFEGILLNDALKGKMKLTDRSLISDGLVCFASVDGYRSIFSFSELFNRADQALPILAIIDGEADGGYYRIFLPTDFYADRSVKGLSEIYIFKE